MLTKSMQAAAGSASDSGIKYVGGMTQGLGTTTTVTFGGNLTGGLSSSPETGDMVLIFLGQGGSGSNPRIDGYNLVYADTKGYIGYKFMGGTPDTTVYIEVNNSTDRLKYPSAVVIQVFRNVNPDVPFDVLPVITTTATTTVDPSAITPVTEGAVIVASGVLSRVLNSDGTVLTSSDLTGFRRENDVRCNTTGCDSTCVGAGYYEWTSGSFNPAAFSYAGGSYQSVATVCSTLALRPIEATVPSGILYKGGYAVGTAGGATPVTLNFGGSISGGLGPLSLGDLIVVYISTMSGSATGISSVTNNSGSAYTQLTYITANDSYDANLFVGYKFVDSVTNDKTIIVNKTGNLNSGPGFAFQVFRGVDTASPLVGSIQTATGINSALCDPPAITPNVTGSVIVAGGAGAAAANLSIFTSSDLSYFVSASGYTSNVSTAGSGIKYWTSGSFDPAQFSATGSDTSCSWAGATLALNPD